MYISESEQCRILNPIQIDIGIQLNIPRTPHSGHIGEAEWVVLLPFYRGEKLQFKEATIPI